MTFITLKDTHFRFGFKHPTGRTEDFEAQIKAKVDFVIETGKKYGAEALILTGDTFDFKAVSHWNLKPIRENSNVIKELKEAFGTLFDIHGNHSLPNSSLAYKKDSFQSFLIEQNLIHDIAEQPFQIDDDYLLYGIDFTPDKEALLQKMREMDRENDDTNLIAVIHEHLVPTDKDRLPYNQCLTYNEITKGLKNHKVIIAGHLHKGYPTQTVNGVIIINQWNFTRLARDYYTVSDEHKPQLTIVKDVLQGGNYVLKTKTIDIPCEPYKTAFIEKELQREQNLGMDITEFIAKTTEAQQDNNISFYPAHLKSKIEYYLEQAQRT